MHAQTIDPQPVFRHHPQMQEMIPSSWGNTLKSQPPSIAGPRRSSDFNKSSITELQLHGCALQGLIRSEVNHRFQIILTANWRRWLRRCLRPVRFRGLIKTGTVIG